MAQENEAPAASAPVDEASSLLTDTEQAEALGQDGLTPRLANGNAGMYRLMSFAHARSAVPSVC